MRKKTIWASQPNAPIAQSPLLHKILPNPDIRALVPNTLMPPALSQLSPSLTSSSWSMWPDKPTLIFSGVVLGMVQILRVSLLL